MGVDVVIGWRWRVMGVEVVGGSGDGSGDDGGV